MYQISDRIKQVLYLATDCFEISALLRGCKTQTGLSTWDGEGNYFLIGWCMRKMQRMLVTIRRVIYTKKLFFVFKLNISFFLYISD